MFCGETVLTASPKAWVRLLMVSGRRGLTKALMLANRCGVADRPGRCRFVQDELGTIGGQVAQVQALGFPKVALLGKELAFVKGRVALHHDR